MKPTETQIKFLDACIKILESYKVTNDINSTTHLSDTYDEVNQLDEVFDFKGNHLELDSALCTILQLTKKLENDKNDN